MPLRLSGALVVVLIFLVVADDDDGDVLVDLHLDEAVLVLLGVGGSGALGKATKVP